MAETQLEKYITLSKSVADRQMDMNRKSVATSNSAKSTKKRTHDRSAAGDRDSSGIIKSKYFNPSRTSRHRTTPKPQHQPDIRTALTSTAQPRPRTPPSPKHQPDLSPTTTRILHSSLSPFRQRVLLALCQVPHGQHTTYAALSTFLASSPRAVGNAMRNNPFAPAVPCHRVLAANGGIGGFGGEWGPEGKFAREKRALLREEGVRFDGGGRVVGGVWRGFV